MEVQILLRDNPNNIGFIISDIDPNSDIYDLKMKIKDKMDYPID